MGETVQTRLQELLALRGMTQGELADALGVTPGAVSQWLGGSKQPSRENVKAAAEYLRVGASWLESGEGPRPSPDEEAERRSYLSSTGWRFRPTHPDGGRDYGNANIWTFTPTLETLVREALQNVLDARAGDSTVDARLTIVRLSGASNLEELKRFLAALRWQELSAHLEASKDTPQKIGSLLRYALGRIDLDRPEETELFLLRVEDSNTTGLIGPETEKGNFAALTRNNLDSSKASSMAAGAFGLGKGVFWRASYLATVLFNSNLIEPEDGRATNRIIGRTELPWHSNGGDDFAGPGWFGTTENQPKGRVSSVWENATLARDLLLEREPSTSGSSILVVGFHDPSSEENSNDPRKMAAAIESAAAVNFWPAIVRGDLRVIVETADGSRITSRSEVDPSVMAREYADAFSRWREGRVSESLSSCDDVAAVSIQLDVPRRTADPDKHKALTQECTLLVRACDDDAETMKPRGQLAVFRGAGMVVRTFDLPSIRLGARPFRAALLCGTAVDTSPEAQAAERFLRTSEPPAHNNWELTQEVKAEYYSGGGAAISRLIERAKTRIADLVAPDYSSLSDGPRDLKSLFRIAPPTEGDRKPRVRVERHFLDESGRLNVRGRVITDGKKSWSVRPVLVFVGENGEGLRARWQEMRLEDAHELGADGRIHLPVGTSVVSFVAATDPSTHPIPAEDAVVRVELRDLSRGR